MPAKQSMFAALIALALAGGSGAATAQDQAPAGHDQSAPSPKALPRDAPGDQSTSRHDDIHAGVIAPPHTGDSGAVKSPPHGTADQMVIPPPGSTGGNAEVQQK